MGEKDQEIYEFLQIKSDGTINFAVVDVQLAGKNRLLWSTSAKVLDRFVKTDASLDANEKQRLNDFLAQTLNKFQLLYPMYKEKMKAIYLFLPDDMIDFETKWHHFVLSANEKGNYQLKRDTLLSEKEHFEAKLREQYETKTDDCLIGYELIANKIDNQWVHKSHALEKTLLSDPNIAFGFEVNKINKIKWKSLCDALTRRGLEIKTISSSSRSLMNKDIIKAWLSNGETLIYHWEDQEVLIKYYDGLGSLKTKKTNFGVNNLYQAVLKKLNLDEKSDFNRIKNLYENYLDFKDFDLDNSVFLRQKNQDNKIITYSKKELIKVFIVVLDEFVKKLDELTYLEFKVNANLVKQTVHTGVLEQIKSIETQFGRMKIKFLQTDYDAMFLGGVRSELHAIAQWASDLKQSLVNRTTKMKNNRYSLELGSNQNDLANLVSKANRSHSGAKTMAYYRIKDEVIIKKI